MKNFQLRILMIQLVASCLLFLGIQQLYVLAEMDLIELIHSIGKDNFAYYVQKSDEFGISNQLKRLSTTKIILSIIGIAFAPAEILDAEIEQLIAERQIARENRDFVLSDKIRDDLKAQGIALLDTPDGVRWTRD